MKNYYIILEVSDSATSSEIKKAYRKLAVAYHPDRNEGSALAEEKFKEINEAYQVLSDPEKKNFYDLSLITGESYAPPEPQSEPENRPPPPVYAQETVSPLNENDAQRIINWSVGIFIGILVIFTVAHFLISYYSAVVFTAQAEEALKKGDYPDALKNIHSALDKEPDYAPAHFLAGKVQLQEIGHYDKAVDYFSQAILLTDTVNLEFHLLRAKSYFKNEEKLFSIEDLEIILSENKKHTEANLMLAEVLISETKDVKRALTLLEISAHQFPFESELLKGIAYQQLGDFVSALQALNNARVLKKNSGKVFYHLGLHQYYHQNNTDDACKTFLYAYDLGEKKAEIMFNKACK